MSARKNQVMVRFTDDEWSVITQLVKSSGKDAAVWARDMCLTKNTIVVEQATPAVDLVRDERQLVFPANDSSTSRPPGHESW